MLIRRKSRQARSGGRAPGPSAAGLVAGRKPQSLPYQSLEFDGCKNSRQSGVNCMPTQHSCAKCVRSAEPQAFGGAVRDGARSFPHFARGFVGEGDGQDLAGEGAAGERDVGGAGVRTRGSCRCWRRPARVRGRRGSPRLRYGCWDARGIRAWGANPGRHGWRSTREGGCQEWDHGRAVGFRG